MKKFAIVASYLLTIVIGQANEISASQKRWIETYKKQANIPKPEAMLLNTEAEPDLVAGFESLYNGKDLDNWTARGGQCKFEARGEAIVGTCVKGSPSTYLSTKKDDYTDFVFSAELKWMVDGNTGIMFRAASKPGGKQKGAETIFGPQAEMEAFSKKRYWSGGIYGQSAGGWIYPMWLDAHEKVRQSMKEGDWNRITIEAKGDTVRTWLNGIPAAHWKTDDYKEGFFSLQIHAGQKGEVHFRNIKIKELAPATAASKRAAGTSPNFIFILSDDAAQGDLGCYGQKLIKTPRLDQLAAEGTRYLQAYCGTTVCAPSRSSFFTGLHSGHCPVRGNYELPPEGQLPLPDSTVTIAEVAKSAGYATATFGKWGMGYFDTSGAPQKQGVDHFFGYNCQRHAHSYFPTYLYDDAQAFILPGNDGKKVGETYAQELIQNDMLEWLGKNGSDPFMMFYAITLPHGPHEIDDFGIYKDKPWSDKQKAYAAQISRIDSDVGEMVDKLRELGIAENTLVIFSGDNGSSFSPDSEIGKLFDQASNGLRGFKRGMYEGALRQAAFAWWPGTIPAGRVDAQPWAFWDLMPTFVELSGAKPPEGYETDGHSLVDYLKGGDAPQRDYFYWELHEGERPVQAARFDQWKAVRNGIDRRIEIYDLENDSAESSDLAPTRADLVAKAQSIFDEAHRPDPNWPLDHRTEEHTQLSKQAWDTKRKRDQGKWVPAGAGRRAL
jgi:arylsulfatase A-like enzyme